MTTTIILETIGREDNKKKEYRVANVELNILLWNSRDNTEVATMDVLLGNARLLYANAPVFSTSKEAEKHARTLGCNHIQYFYISEVF